MSAVKERFGLDGQVFETSESAHEHDWFPAVQRPFIAHVDRVDMDRDDLGVSVHIEDMIRELGKEMGGDPIGT